MMVLECLEYCTGEVSILTNVGLLALDSLSTENNKSG
jgi:hypothetical protein